MELLTKEIISKFESHPIGSQDGKGLEAEVLVKYFNPCGAGTWLITEAEREGDDWRLFGYCSEIERNLISQRTKEALARKKIEGVILGRPKGKKVLQRSTNSTIRGFSYKNY